MIDYKLLYEETRRLYCEEFVHAYMLEMGITTFIEQKSTSPQDIAMFVGLLDSVHTCPDRSKCAIGQFMARAPEYVKRAQALLKQAVQLRIDRMEEVLRKKAEENANNTGF